MATAAELLADVETAIQQCLTAQSYSIGAGQHVRSKQMAHLAQLVAFRQQLKDEISNGGDSSGSMCSLLQMGEATL